MAALVRSFSFVAQKTALQASSSGPSHSTSLAPPRASVVRSATLRGSSGSRFYGQSGRLIGPRTSGVALRQTRLAGEGGTRAMFTGLVEEMGTVKEVRVLEDLGFETTIEASVV